MGWKIFSMINAVLTVVAIVYTFSYIDEFALFGALGQAASVFGAVIMAPISALGLLAYAFNLTLFKPGFWHPFAYVNTIWLALAFLHTLYDAVLGLAAQWSIPSLIGALIGLLIGAAFVYYSWLGVWRYARMRAQAA